MKRINIILVSLFVVFTTSCKKNVSEPLAEDKKIAQEIKNLIYFKGDENADIVLVNTQGGPDTELATDEFDDLLKNVNTSGILRVNVHQAQTLNPELFTKNEITFAEATNFDTKSVDTLYKVIKYFKDQNRTVYVLGISFGAFMTQQLIAEKGINTADKYLIMVGRLDINDVFWQAYSQGETGHFVDGLTPVLYESGSTVTKNMNKLAAGLGQNRYTQTLGQYQNLSKLTYVYGKNDFAVGKLLSDEIQFLKSRKAKIIAGDGNHSETIDGYIVAGFKAAFGF